MAYFGELAVNIGELRHLRPASGGFRAWVLAEDGAMMAIFWTYGLASSQG